MPPESPSTKEGLKTAFGAAARFRGDLAAHWRALSVAFGCSLAYAAARLAEPWPLKVIFDNALASRPLDTPFAWLDRLLAGDRTRILIAASLTLVLLAVLRGFFYYYQRFLTSKVGQEVVLKIRRRLFAHLQRLPLRFHERSSTGDLLTRLTGDINMLRELIVASLLSLVSETVLLVGFIAVMLLVEWRLALVALVVMPLVFVLVTVYSRRIRAATRK
ncbi:MAG: ABC transporter transmembrane domain-containing protein, partial [Actinomycetota bacterium]|nr:ABC transporter transmembrane domain-containing protein [Actinomycetota bacterium]